jgi:bifunctional aspartokinase / homoserine dehydrogenase 1
LNKTISSTNTAEGSPTQAAELTEHQEAPSVPETDNLNKLHILKFGGSSVANPVNIMRAVNIIKGRMQIVDVAVVVSALGGVTDEIIALMDKSLGRDPVWRDRFASLRDRHLKTLTALIGENYDHPVVTQIESLLAEFRGRLETIAHEQSISGKTRDHLLSYGERMSCRIFAAALEANGVPAKAWESHHFVRTNNRFGDADVDSETTNKLIRRLLGERNGHIPVITGFIGSTAENEITTLGRSGSDYTASIIGEALQAREVEIWSDVNGVLTADPRLADTAVTIPQLNYSEIAEMAHFGTKVLHPRTVLPLEQSGIPVTIRNTFEPDHTGTLISHDYVPSNGTLRAVALKKDIVLIGLRSSGLDRIHSLLTRAMEGLKAAGVDVLFNASASADYGITFVVGAAQSDQTVRVLRNIFEVEYAKGLIEEPARLDNVSMVTVIGDRLQHDLGLSGAVLSVLGENQIAPLAMAKGVSNRHLSLLVHNEVERTAVQLLNDHFCVHGQRVRLFIAGLGTIGSALLRQIGLTNSTEYDLTVIGACDSQHVAWNPNGIRPDAVIETVNSGDVTEWGAITDRLINHFAYRTIFIDTTGSEEVARHYSKLLKAGIHVTSTNNRANSGEQANYDELMHYTLGKRTHYLYETTAGAGLPVIQTIKDLMRTGDRINSITAAASGTMTFLFEALAAGRPFGETIREARRLGYSEPDPRDDLSGEDVARKLMVLTRASGFRVERDEFSTENLIPESLRTVTLEEFWQRLDEYDQEWKARSDEALASGRVLRYVGRMEKGRIHIGVEAVERLSPMGSLKGTDNLFAIRSDRYPESPLIIQGPGAGKEVTAAGLLADVQKIGIRIVR